MYKKKKKKKNKTEIVPLPQHDTITDLNHHNKSQIPSTPGNIQYLHDLRHQEGNSGRTRKFSVLTDLSQEELATRDVRLTAEVTHAETQQTFSFSIT